MVLFATFLLLGSAPRHAQAQSLLPSKALEFGQVLPGVDKSVSPGDPERAVLYLLGTGRFSIQLIAPTAMYSPQGAALSMEIGSQDAVLTLQNGNTRFLDPGGVTRVAIQPWWLFLSTIYIGGTVRPSVNQAPGGYTGTIVVQISASGT